MRRTMCRNIVENRKMKNETNDYRDTLDKHVKYN